MNYERRRQCVGVVVVGAVLGLMQAATLGAEGAATQPAWNEPTVVIVPAAVGGVGEKTVALNDWRMLAGPVGEFWANSVDTSSWSPMRGGRGGRGGPGAQATGEFTAAYRTQLTIPADWAGKRVVVRFEGVADGAKLWVNGVFVRDHWGPFMPWSADITDQVTAGSEASITLGVNEKREGLNQFVRGGGIQRPAMLIALPADYLTRLHVTTTFDDQFVNAILHVDLAMAFYGGAGGHVRLTLKDDKGNAIALDPSEVELTSDAAEKAVAIPVMKPRKWDAEHPNLYTLEASVLDGGGVVTQTVSRTIGFRQAAVKGNRFYVNGNEVKFRGIWGMNSVAEIKALNANHTRQKWVTEQFLNDADRLGLYVLDEVPVDFAKYGVESDPQYESQWMGLISDMMERDEDHPSVIMWGLGNESFNGPNILQMFKYVQAHDAQRPAMFSWANRVPADQELPYSVYSSHYPNLNDPKLNLGDYDVAKWHSTSLVKLRKPPATMPVLHDEFSHVVLNQDLLNRDPNVRNFWGESIDRYWEKMFVTPGALGGDLFGFGGGFGGPGGQGIEHYLAREAYSPVRIANQPLQNPGPGRLMIVPVKNWYDHTNLDELTVRWAVGSETGVQAGPDIGPHLEGVMEIPPREWKDGDELSLKFSLADGTAVDEFLLAVNPAAVMLPAPHGPAPKLEETAGQIVVSGEKFKVVFDKYKGQISQASYDGKTAIIDGPCLDLLGSGLAYGEWWCDKIAAHVEGNEAVVEIKGNYAVIRASFVVRIDGTGLISTKYTVDFVPGDPPPVTYSPWNATSTGGYSEVGVSYMLPAGTAALSWKRKGLWSVYPADHIGRNEGTAANGTDDFRATKENIYFATATIQGGATVTAESDGRDAVRLSADPGYRVLPGGVRMGIHNLWNYPDIGLGNYTKPPINLKSGYTNTVYLRLGE